MGKTIKMPDIFQSDSAVKKNTSRRKANELDGKTWLQYSISIWNDVKKSTEEIRLKHPAMFPVQLVKRLLEVFTTKEKDKVLDPFMGVGSTLIAAQQLNKNGFGFEISKKYIEIAESRISNQTQMFASNDVKQEIHLADARRIDEYLGKESIDICITSPPYWDILSEKRTADYKEIKDYDEIENNLGNIHNYERFLKELKVIFEKVYTILKRGSYCIVVVMDLRKKSKFYPYHLDVVNFMKEVGFVLDDIIIWDRRNEYSELRPLGYPSVFRVNKIHEYLLIFQKPQD